ncbi:unnamed protein product [Schistocephalus solidus]|uniref:PepX_C domain-containing protein n=1 Tax=Schistocephalus solidus TaxID=70667 RepID=A0A183S7U2_SCHSO|nr:unnamed protein product [Schistocephalus solidus]
MDTNTTGTSTYHFASWLTAERPTPLPDSHPITYGQAVTFAYQLTSATPYGHQTVLLRDAIRAESPPFTAYFSKLKPYRGRLPVCTADSLPILPANQVPPVAIKVTVPHNVDPPSTEDSAAS